MDLLNIEYQWKKYLELTNLKEEDMPEDQIRETKRAFYGAWGQLLRLLQDTVGTMEDEEGVAALKNMLRQVQDYWLKQFLTNKQK